MQIYVVGGAVRDRLLGLAVHDRDYVVTGATPKEMIDLGFLPVGRDFPVFLHPETREEYALARTERKTAPGYDGFVFHADVSVTLEEDLLRRDLTINAIAETLDGSKLIDPCGGQEDLKAHCFRHVGPAFVEDPVRLLRLARFAARFPQFDVAPDTLALLYAMVDAGEVDALVPERVWAELARGFMAARPSRMIALLDQVGAMARIASAAPAGDALDALDAAAAANAPLAVRYAVWLAAGGLDAERARQVSAALRAPREVRDLAVFLTGQHQLFGRADLLQPSEILELLEGSDAMRRPERFAQLLDAHALLHRDQPLVAAQRRAVEAALALVRGVDAGAVAAQHAGADIKLAVRNARLNALLAASAT